jgi:ubiquinone/menaquinone biosynthesis C-methylase UbiE
MIRHRRCPSGTYPGCVPDQIDYDRHQYTVYARGRALPEVTMTRWMEVFSGCAPAGRPLTVLDLGSGTGRFTPWLADAFGGPVFGVEPSQRMREVAERSASHPAVTYLDGAAERIPLPPGSCDLALMYLVLHHVQDRPAAAREISRVLRPGGRLLIQSTFPGTPSRLWHRYFPCAREIEARVFPSVEEVTRVFSQAGFGYVALERVRIQLAPSLAAYLDRMRLRAISTFEHMTEKEIAAGFAALEADVAAETVPRPVEDDATLLVLALDSPAADGAAG